METWIASGLSAVLHWFALPEVGLSTVFIVAFVSATLLPLGSEPAVFALVKLNPEMFWPAIAVATVGNTLGGALTWAMGWAARRGRDRLAVQHPGLVKAGHARALRWLQRFGAPACLLSWLPVVGDPLCAVAGWLRLPFWPCVFYMAVGKAARYISLTAALIAMV